MEKQVDAVEEKKDKKKNKIWLIIILILLLLLGLGAGYLYQLKQTSGKSRLARDADAFGGLLPGKTPEEISDLLGEIVQEGMVNINIAYEPIFEYGGKKGRLGIENIPANRYSFQVSLYLADDDLLYESGIIDPGHYIEYVELNRTLQAGDYPAKAVFTTYSLDESEDEIAKAEVDIILHVMDGLFYR